VAQRFLGDAFTLRGGLHRSGGQDQWNMALGGGLRYRNFDFDYAWDTTDQLGNTQTLSLAMRFGK
jgi:hypothetical protein